MLAAAQQPSSRSSPLRRAPRHHHLLRLLAAALLTLLPASAQLAPGEKLLRVMEADKISDAVLITNISVAGKPINCGLWIKWPDIHQPVTPFPAPDDWLRQVTVSLFNRTSKTIVFGSIGMNFLDTGDCRTVPCAGAQIEFGQVPSVDAYDERTGMPAKRAHPGVPPLEWKPLSQISIRIADHMDDINRSTLSRFIPVTQVTNVLLFRGAFYFPDGMRWMGNFAVPDPDHPGKFKRLPPNYFPGPRGLNLPPKYTP